MKVRAKNFLLQNIWIDKENNRILEYLQEDLEHRTLENLIAWHSFEASMYKSTTEW